MRIALTVALVALTVCFTTSSPLFETPINGGKIWALLVAGSKGFWNYRHQADICHAYQILHSNGIPDENIVVMMYDDIAGAAGNPLPGKIINKPGGHDVYAGVLKDYTGVDVNAKNFLNILQGNKKAMKKIGSGKVIESGPNDHIFVNFVDHGGPGVLGFPNGPLYADELMTALKSMVMKKAFKKMLLYIEACNGGSMFEHFLPDNVEIVASTAANPNESSMGCYCNTKPFWTCLGDVYSVTWMEHLDAISAEQEKKETVLMEYKYVKKHVNTSHVMLYGDEAHLDSNKISTFLGISKNKVETPVLPESNPQLSAVPSGEVAVESLKMQIELSSSTDAEKEKLTLTLKKLLDMRKMVDNTMTSIAKQVTQGNVGAFSDLVDKHYPATSEVMPCYKEMIEHFNAKCVCSFKNSYVLRYFYMFLNMCSMDSVNKEDVVAAFNLICTYKHRNASGIQ